MRPSVDNMALEHNYMQKVEDQIQLPNWTFCDKFEAQTKHKDTIYRIANDIIFAIGALYALYICTGERQNPSPLVACVVYTCLLLTMRKVLAASLGYFVCPAARSSLFMSHTTFYQRNQISKQFRVLSQLNEEGFIARKLVLQYGGTHYDAIAVAHKDYLSQKAWMLRVCNNTQTLENVVIGIAKNNIAHRCHTLVINGPSVGLSGGWPTRYQWLGSVEAGLQLLEKKMRASHIIMYGQYLEAGLISEAIIHHKFDKQVLYLAIMDRTFSYLSRAMGATMRRAVEPFFYLTNIEMDNISAARRLTALQITQVVIQAIGNDQWVPNAVSLLEVLREQNLALTKSKHLLSSSHMIDYEKLNSDVQLEFNQIIDHFVKTTNK